MRELKVGIVGTGYIADFYMEILRKIERVNVVGCYDINLEKAQCFRKRWGIKFRCDCLDDLLRITGESGAVFVLTPPDSHFIVAKQVISAKVNVFLEKPMTIRSSECEKLIGVARENNVKIGVNHNAIFHPLFLRLRKDVFVGRIGQVSHVVIYQAFPLKEFDTRKFYAWKFRNPQNIVFERAPHPFSQVLTLLGDFKNIKAKALGKKEISYNNFFYTIWEIVVECEKGNAYVHMSFGDNCFPQNFFMISGKSGSVHIDFLNGSYLIHDNVILPDYLTTLKGIRYLGCVFQGIKNSLNCILSKVGLKERNDGFYLSIKNSVESFCNALMEGIEIPVAGNDGYKVVAACERVVESAKVEGNISVPEISSRKKPEVLVTGANGFIGATLIEKLTERGKVVRALVRGKYGIKKSLFSPNVEIQVGDVANLKDVKEAVKGVKYVYHLAQGGSGTWESFYRTNIVGTKYIAGVSLSAKVRYFIYTSTILVYHLVGFPQDSLITERCPIDSFPSRRSFYVRSKILAERLLGGMAKDKGLPLLIFRPGIVMGKGCFLYPEGVAKWITKDMCIYWRKKKIIPFVLVDDLTEALLKVLDIDGLEGEIFNLVGKVNISAQKYIEYLRLYTGCNIKAFPYLMPLFILSEGCKYIIKKVVLKDKNSLFNFHDFRNRYVSVRFDCSKAEMILSWDPCSDEKIFMKRAVGWIGEGDTKIEK